MNESFTETVLVSMKRSYARGYECFTHIRAAYTVRNVRPHSRTTDRTDLLWRNKRDKRTWEFVFLESHTWRFI